VTEQEYRELEPLWDQLKAEVPLWDSISITRVQRTYRFGYNRAARLLESLAEYGVLSWNKRTGQFSRASTVEGSRDG
jgi:DNA segregation ATPase FtsK/SpoIIIE-like protein